MCLKYLFKRKKKNQQPAQQMAVPGQMGVPGQMPFPGQMTPQTQPMPQGQPTPMQQAGGDRTMLLQEEPEDDRTVLLIDDGDQDMSGVGSLMAILELSNPPIEGAPQSMTIFTNKKEYSIGRATKSGKMPDMAFSKDFRTVGRKHAKIEIMGTEIYITDLGSTNHTTLDGQILDPNRPYPLKDGCEVGFTITNPVKYRFSIKQ